MPATHSLPEPFIRSYVAGLARDADAVERWQGLAGGTALRKVIAELTGLLDNLTYRWVTPDVVAGIMKCSAETIRRQCRTEAAPFLFEQDEESGRYRIWLASVPGREADPSATPTETSTEGDQP